MKKEDIEIKIAQLVGLFDYLLSIEDFPAYKKLKENYYNLLCTIQQRLRLEDIQEVDFRVVQSSFRIMMEAPPRDITLGKYILDRMQEIYEIQIKIIKSGK